MKIKGTFLLLILFTVLSSCNTIKNLSDSELSLVGTTWFYKDSIHDWDYEILFLENGKIQTTHPNDNSPENDTWTQNEKALELSFNDAYSIYKGNRVAVDKIKGKASNVNGKEWKWTLTKK